MEGRSSLLMWEGRRYVVAHRRLHDVYVQDRGTPNPLLWWVFDQDIDGDPLGNGRTKRAAMAAAGLEDAAELCGCPPARH